MKAAELIDELRELPPDQEIRFLVRGTVSTKQELTGRYSGYYDLEMNVDAAVELYCIDNTGEITLWL